VDNFLLDNDRAKPCAVSKTILKQHEQKNITQ